MAKKRKSREEKLKADLRHFNYHFEAPIAKAPKNIDLNETVRVVQTQTTTHPYLKHDLLKTVMVTSAMIVTQILIFSFLKIHTFSNLGIKY